MYIWLDEFSKSKKDEPIDTLLKKMVKEYEIEDSNYREYEMIYDDRIRFTAEQYLNYKERDYISGDGDDDENDWEQYLYY